MPDQKVTPGTEAVPDAPEDIAAEGPFTPHRNDFSGDYARDPQAGTLSDDYARDRGWSGAGRGDDYVREEPPAPADEEEEKE